MECSDADSKRNQVPILISLIGRVCERYLVNPILFYFCDIPIHGIVALAFNISPLLHSENSGKTCNPCRRILKEITSRPRMSESMKGWIKGLKEMHIVVGLPRRRIVERNKHPFHALFTELDFPSIKLARPDIIWTLILCNNKPSSARIDPPRSCCGFYGYFWK